MHSLYIATFLTLLGLSDSLCPPTNIAGRADVAVKSVFQDDVPMFDYVAGNSEGPLGKKFGHLAGRKIRTVGEAFADFTDRVGHSIHALYKSMLSDTVGQTHLIISDVRFKRDPVWSLGLITALDDMLGTYPDKPVAQNIRSAYFNSMQLDEKAIRSEAAKLTEWSQGKSREDIENALASVDTSSMLGAIIAEVKSDRLWKYSRYFGIGLVKLMDFVGIEMEDSTVCEVMHDWTMSKLGRTSSLNACSDSMEFLDVKRKLESMETMIQEVEIREKRRTAQRLEAKAERALKTIESLEEQTDDTDLVESLRKAKENSSQG